MVRVKNSDCHCGKCGNTFSIRWDLEIVNTTERQMGKEVEYLGETKCTCPDCGNTITGVLSVFEYPTGCLNMKEIKDVTDSYNTADSTISEPAVAFFDL